MTPGEHYLADQLAKANENIVFLVTQREDKDQLIQSLKAGYDEVRSVLTPAQKTKLGIEDS